MRILGLLPLVLLLGCAARQYHNIDVRIPIACLTRDPLLTQCDTGVSPPRCHSSQIAYKAGCEQVEVKK